MESPYEELGNTYQSIGTLFQSKEIVKKKTPPNKRASVIKELYELYKMSYTPTPKYPNPISVKLFCIKLSPLKDLNILYYLLSGAKDRYNRGESVGKYVLGVIKLK